MRQRDLRLVALLLGVVAAVAAVILVATHTSTRRLRSIPLLSWSPPAMDHQVTHHVGGSTGTTYQAPRSQDTRIVFDSVVTTRLNLSGGHNWVIIGGEVDITAPAAANTDAGNGITVSGATGTIYVEGVYLHGSSLNDGLKGNSPSATWIMQNSLIAGVHGRQSAYHADAWQPADGFAHFFMDRVTAYTEMQGGMIKSDGPVPWGDTDWRNVNIVGFNDRDSYPINVILGTNERGVAYTTGPVRTSGLFLQPDPGHHGGALSGNVAPSADFAFTKNAAGEDVAATWDRPDLLSWTGTIRKGRPNGVDYVTPADVGLGYVSPGYSADPARDAGAAASLGTATAGAAGRPAHPPSPLLARGSHCSRLPGRGASDRACEGGLPPCLRSPASITCPSP